MADQDGPKIIIDDDWKREAQAEKARLAEQEKAKAAKATPGQGGGEGPDGPVGFEDLVKTFASQAMMYLGYIPDPQSGRAVVAPEYARLYIDFLGVLEEKTKGNLTEEEDELLRSMVTELRMAYVEVGKAVAKAVQEGKIKPMSGGGIAGSAGSVMPPPPPPPAGL